VVRKSGAFARGDRVVIVKNWGSLMGERGTVESDDNEECVYVRLDVDRWRHTVTSCRPDEIRALDVVERIAELRVPWWRVVLAWIARPFRALRRRDSRVHTWLD